MARAAGGRDSVEVRDMADEFWENLLPELHKLLPLPFVPGSPLSHGLHPNAHHVRRSLCSHKHSPYFSSCCPSGAGQGIS
jgi:hypothetical protein